MVFIKSDNNLIQFTFSSKTKSLKMNEIEELVKHSWENMRIGHSNHFARILI